MGEIPREGARIEWDGTEEAEKIVKQKGGSWRELPSEDLGPDARHSIETLQEQVGLHRFPRGLLSSSHPKPLRWALHQVQ